MCLACRRATRTAETTTTFACRRAALSLTRSTMALVRPGISWMVSGNAIEKSLLSGSLYLMRTTCLETFFTMCCFVYSPPGCQPAAHVSPSPQSTPKWRMRSMRPSGAALSDWISFDGFPAGHCAGSPPSTDEVTATNHLGGDGNQPL